MMERMVIKVLDEWAAAGHPVQDRDFSTEGGCGYAWKGKQDALVACPILSS